MHKHNYARLVMLVKDGVEVQIHEDLMHEYISVIWASLNYSSRKRMKVGGVYREHQLLLQSKPNPTLTDEAQQDWWNSVIDIWKLAARDSMCTLIGDTNLDHLRWDTPEQSHATMVENTKDEIESAGFTHVIHGFTRQWR